LDFNQHDLETGPLREILPAGTKPIPGPLASGALVKTCIAFLYSRLIRI